MPSTCYLITTYEVHTFKNKNKRKSLRDIFVHHFLFYDDDDDELFCGMVDL